MTMHGTGWMRRSLKALLLGTVAATSPAWAQSFCVYDPLGTQGDFYSLFKDYQLAAKRWGVNVELRAYTDDNPLNTDFKSGKCDMASMIGMRARAYNQFTGTLDAPGTIENYVQVRDVMELMASPKLAKYMSNDGYEVVGVMPVGAGYAVVNDRHINSLAAAAGKRAGYMSWDRTQTQMAQDFHITPVPSDLVSYGSHFNHGDVDIIIAPMALYKPMELYKGIGDKGGIIHRPLFEFTLQLLSHEERFPNDFGQQSREYMSKQVDHALGIIRNDEAQVDARSWIYALHSEQVQWSSSMRQLLAHMVSQGLFDNRMLAILQRVRCKSSPGDDGCAGVADASNVLPDGLAAH